MVTDPAAAGKILSSWSREVELTFDGKLRVNCEQCMKAYVETSYFVTAGRPDRVRCPKCKTLFMIEL